MHNILFELGIVLFLGFFAALAMKKINQSVIVGYMAVGLLIGPNALNLVKNTELLETLSELGIVLLMFFLGLEFSLNKFKRIKNSVFFIGTYEVILNLIVGFVIGTLLGLLFKERLFLAGIIALSSSGVVAKLLFDMKKTASKESEILMGVMVFEDFFAVVLLGILSGISRSDTLQFGDISMSLVKAVAFYAVFIIIGVLFINKVIDTLTKIESQELFTALMIGTILLIGSLAVYMGLASAAGAFLLGMLIVSYDVEERLHRTVSAFKDIFLIIFFISFGTLLDYRQIPATLPLIVVAVPATIAAELVITTSAAFFSGFTLRSAVAIGSSMIARGEYSLIYAYLGYSTGALSLTLYQFTGVYVFIMTLIAPVAMKNSDKICKFISLITPRFLKYGAKLVSVTMRPLLLPEELGVKLEKSYKFIIYFSLYIFIVLATIISSVLLKHNIIITLCPAAAGIIIVFLLRAQFASKIKNVEEQINYKDMHEGHYNLDHIMKFILNLFTSLLFIIVLGSAFLSFGYIVLALLLALFSLYLIAVSLYVYKASIE